MLTKSVFVCFVQTDPFYNPGQVLIAPSEASHIDVERTKITVSSDPFVRGASIKVAEGFTLSYVLLLRSAEVNRVCTHSYMLLETTHHPT